MICQMLWCGLLCSGWPSLHCSARRDTLPGVQVLDHTDSNWNGLNLYDFSFNHTDLAEGDLQQKAQASLGIWVPWTDLPAEGCQYLDTAGIISSTLPLTNICQLHAPNHESC